MRFRTPTQTVIGLTSLLALFGCMGGEVGRGTFQYETPPESNGADDATPDQVDEGAADPHPCGPLGISVETDAGQKCECPHGTTAVASGCVDVDECSRGEDECEAPATCVNTPGGYYCQCPDGSPEDPQGCQEPDDTGDDDVDECSRGEDECEAPATCVNTPGGYYCQCPDGSPEDPQGCQEPDDTGDDDVDEPPVDPEPETRKVRILLMGDSQKTTDQKPDDFLKTTSRLLTDSETKDADFLLHMGDITEDDKTACWEVAQKGLYQLDGHMPYVLNVGNNDGSGGKFIKYFPLDKYRSWPSYVSHYNDHRNIAHHFRAGGVDWLVISIIHHPGGSEVGWAEGLIKNHPDKKVIILNHTQGLGDGNIVWNMIKKYPNVVFSFLGHNVVMHEMLTANDGHKIGRAQTCWHSTQRDSYLGIVELDTEAGTAAFRYYSPLYGKNYDDPPADNRESNPWTWSGFKF